MEKQPRTTRDSDWTPIRLSASMIGKAAIVAALVYLVVSERGMGATFGLLVLLLSVWIFRDMVRLVIQRPDPAAATDDSGDRDAADEDVSDAA